MEIYYSVSGTIIDELDLLTLEEFSFALHTQKEIVMEMIEYKLLEPKGNNPNDWRFGSSALRRGRIAASFLQELEVNMPGVALALELLDKIETLQQQLKIKE